MRIVLDVENDFSIIKRDGKPSKNDVMPFSGNNSLVSVGIKNIDTGETTYHFFSHSELTHSTEEAARKREEIQQLLLSATLIIGHFLKHDIIWMLCSGFKVPRVKFWDTGIAEYVMHRGQKRPLDLKSLAEKYDLTRKKSDLVSEYFANGTTTSLIPIGILEEYGRGDLDTTGELYLNQCKRLKEQENAGLLPTINMMNDFMYVLARWQMNGIKIDKVELERVKAEYQQEQTLLTARLNEIARKYMGDTPFSITSPEDMSVLIYSRRLLNKKDWKEAFNIGTDERGKSLRRPRMKPAEFASKIRELTVIEYRTKAAQCETCGGTGKVSRELKKGGLSAPRYNCQTCNRVGIIYTPQNRIAGFKFQPDGVKSTSANGFVTDADTIERLAKTATGEPKEFLEKLVRLHAVNVYISTFCDGILNNLTKNNFLHTNFNQTVTATGRLSSTDPNFQNQPRGNTFPVRRAVVSRFKDGRIVDGDFAQLEFRVAGALSGDKQVLHDVLNGVDVHAFTRDTLNAAGMPIDRQGAKSHCIPITTSILTPEGWKKYDEIKVGDTVINYCPIKKALVQDTVLEYIAPHMQEVIRMSNAHNWHVDSTAEHRWYCDRRVDRGKRGRAYESCVTTTQEITKEHRIITSAKYQNRRGVCSADDAARLAWLWTDGTERLSTLTGRTSQGSDGRRRGIVGTIIQKKFVNEIDRLFSGTYSSKCVDESGCIRWSITAQYLRDLYARAGLPLGDTDYCKFVLSLSDEARTAWLNAVYLEEVHNRGRGVKRIAQNSGPLAEAIKLAGFMEGFDIRTTKVTSYTGKQHEQITLRTRRHVTGQRIIKTSLGEQFVWCVRTANGSMVIKNGETIQISGNSFKPLYGGEYGTPAEMTYYQAFKRKYKGVSKWQQEAGEIVLRRKVFTLPTGRQYCWPRAERKWNGKVDFFTQIVNYPVQGFATADIVPLACILLDIEFEKRGLQSIPFLTVHDSISIDTHPEEVHIIPSLVAECMLAVKEELKSRYDYDLTVPLEVEVKEGVNWLDTKVVVKKGHEFTVNKPKNDFIDDSLEGVF